MENRNEQLWRIAKKRAGFKKQFTSYIFVNGFLWAMWCFTEGGIDHREDVIPWPAWATLGWGIGIIFSYYYAYHNDRENDIMREYQKLKDKEGK